MNVQDLIGEVAKRHNVLVDPQDPVFIAVTLNELLLMEHVKNVEAALERAEQSIARVSSRHLEAVRSSTSVAMADASKHVAAQLREGGSAVRIQLQQVVRELETMAETAAAETVRHKRAAERAAAAAIACACLAFGMAVATWLGRL